MLIGSPFLAIALGMMVAIGILDTGAIASSTKTPIKIQNHQRNRQPQEKTTTEAIPISSAEERIADYTFWLMILTGVLAGSTIALWVTTWRASNKQTRDMRASIKASESAALIAERSLVAANRPWIKVVIEDWASITYDVNGANFNFRFRLTNVGRSPAVNVWIHAKIFNYGPCGRNFDPGGDLQELITTLKEEGVKPIGYAIFPNDTLLQKMSIGFSQDELKEAKDQGGGILLPCMIGAVEYRIGFDDITHHTGFIVQMHGKNGLINIDDGDIPVAEIDLSRLPIGGGEYAD